MINLMNGLTYDEYFNKLNEDHKSQMQKSYERTVLSKKAKAFFSDLSEEVRLVIFSEGYCPDCTVVIPFLKRIQELTSKVTISFLSREENIDLLEKCSGESRIPTIITFEKNMQPMGLYLEFPMEFKNNMKILNEKERMGLIVQFREGKYNDMIEKEIMELFKRKG